jgi:transposase
VYKNKTDDTPTSGSDGAKIQISAAKNYVKPINNVEFAPSFSIELIAYEKLKEKTKHVIIDVTGI